MHGSVPRLSHVGKAFGRRGPYGRQMIGGIIVAKKSKAFDHSKYKLWIDPNEVTPYERNAKLHTDKQVRNIANSIKRFGWQQDTVITNDNVLVIGHGRRLAALKLGCEMPYHVIDKNADELTDEDIRELRIADNQTNSETGLDFDLLDVEIADLEFEGFDFDFGQDAEIELEKPEQPEKTEVKYFEDKEIEAAMIEHWKKYDDLAAFTGVMIDEPSAMWQFNRLCQGYNDGYYISTLFNPHRLATETKKSKSIFYAFNNVPGYWKEFARYAVEVQQRVPPQNEYWKLLTIGHNGYQYVNEFQPCIARDIYKRFVKEGDHVLNPCAGWGGRLIGFASCMFQNVEYVETDPQTETFNGLVKLKRFLRLGDNVIQHNLPFEELPVLENYFDFVFTSPPYFDTERYSAEETQSYVRYNSFDTWCTKFLKPMIDKILYCMKPDATCLLNVGHAQYSIDTAIEEYLDSLGVNHYRLQDFKIGGSGIGERTGEGGEPFIAFTKGN